MAMLRDYTESEFQELKLFLHKIGLQGAIQFVTQMGVGGADFPGKGVTKV